MSRPQPTPTVNIDNPRIHDLVVDDLFERMSVGIRRYGTPLRGHNGRDAMWDAYEEVLDLAVYLRQAIWERDHANEEVT